MNMNLVDILIRYQQGFLDGVKVTILLAGLTWCIGISAGCLLGVLSHSSRRLFGNGLRVFAFLLSGIPFLVLIYWGHYPLQVILGVNIDGFYTALAILSLLNTVAVAEICRTSLDDFPEHYISAAKVCGMPTGHIIRFIQLPLIFRQVIPGILNLQVNMLQMTLFASLISVEELFRVAQRINSSIHKPVEIYSALAIFFLIICLPINGLAIWLKYRFTRDISEK